MISGLERNLIRVVLGAVIVGVALFVHAGVSYRDIRAEDVNYEFWRGQMIATGQNPYERALDPGLSPEDEGYVATYFPLFYLLSALTQRLGLKTFDAWINVWRFAFALFDVGIAAVLFWAFHRRGRALVGALAAGFWFFNRWTLHVALGGHVEFLPIFFLVLSLVVFREHQRLSLVLFGVSLALKQMGIFLAPLYVVWVWQSAPEGKVKRAAWGAAAIAAVPLVVSLPFIVWNPEAFFRSVFFSAARREGAHFEAPSLDVAIGLRGFAGRLPMFAMMALVYICSLRRQLGRYVSALLVMAVFIGFNPVLFRQYLTWTVPLVPLCALDVIGAAKAARPGKTGRGRRRSLPRKRRG